MWQSLPLTGTKSDVQSHYKQTLQRQLAERAKARQDSQGETCRLSYLSAVRRVILSSIP